MSQQKPLLGQLPDWTRFPRPVGLWLFNEGSGNKILDLSGNGNHGTFVGSTAWAAGAFGPAANLIANGDNILVPYSPSLSVTNGITISLLVTPVDVYYVGLVSKHDLGSSGYGKWTLFIENNVLIFKVDAGSVVTATGTTTLVANTLYHLVGTYDRQNVKVYVNAIEEGSAADTDPIDVNTTQVNIGTYYQGGAQSFEGLIHSTMIFPFALSASQIAQGHRELFPWFVEDEVSHLYVPGGPPTVKPWWYYRQMESMMRRTG